MTPRPDSRGVHEGSDIKDAIAEFVYQASDMDMRPMVGGFTLVAEIIDPATGKPHLTAIQDAAMPLWVEYGALGLRLNEVAHEWMQAGMYQPEEPG